MISDFLEIPLNDLEEEISAKAVASADQSWIKADRWMKGWMEVFPGHLVDAFYKSAAIIKH